MSPSNFAVIRSEATIPHRSAAPKALTTLAAAALLLAASLPAAGQTAGTRRASTASGDAETTTQQTRSPRTALASPDISHRPRSGGPVIGSEPAQNVPTLSQIGSSTAFVPMKHGSCGQDCGTHVLAVASGNLNMQLDVGMSCPAGRTVTHLSFKPQGQNAISVVGYDTGQASFSKTLFAQPFSKGELESACQQALGGSWAEPGSHNNNVAEVKKTIAKSVNVWGQCSGWANKVLRTYPVSLTLTCRDQSFFVPEG